MVFNTTFNNISVISWRPVLLVEETEVPGENHRSVGSHCLVQFRIILLSMAKLWYITLTIIGCLSLLQLRLQDFVLIEFSHNILSS